MWGDKLASDLQLDSFASTVGLQTPWGTQTFQEGLLAPTSDPAAIKRRQLPLLGLRKEDTIRKAILADLTTVTLDAEVLDDCLAEPDERVSESVSQILWSPDNVTAFLNTSPMVLNGMLTWKTIVLPGVSLLTPLLALVLPFILAFLVPGQKQSSTEILQTIRSVIRSQITLPAPIMERASSSRFGSILEMFFIGFALLMFISGLWQQITAALHLRSIWFDVAERGATILRTVATGKRILGRLESMAPKHSRACRSLIEAGHEAVQACAIYEGLDGGAAYGATWNSSDALADLVDWLALIDVHATIANLDGVCFPTVATDVRLDITGVHHPAVPTCIPNNFRSSSTKSHTLLTGPNRGGKSTFCKAVGLSIVLAQTWGYAYAKSMKWSPFSAVLTGLEPCGKLGHHSTFEAEIEFAKSVLATEGRPLFVMMDEIFHSTNAHDGVEASKVFLSQLYEMKDCISVVSTHYAELTKLFESATALQLVATENAGVLTYTYKVAPGVSSLSSVMDILEERGLLRKSTPSKSAPLHQKPE
jgi:hypothetical protein